MNGSFETDYETILRKVDEIDPLQYARTRNYINGAVTHLSPYISRGVISTKQVLNSVLEKGYDSRQIEIFIKELCWRDYFQRVAQHKNLDQDIRQPQQPVSNYEIPVSIIKATTGIEGIDEAIKELYNTGYMHNHCRMYTASLVCNIAKSYWYQPSRWMYYHLLDGDWASNSCSWQWVAGSNSNKKYYFNQENINKYTQTSQSNTFLDTSYEAIQSMETPASLVFTQEFIPEINLPSFTPIHIDSSLPAFIYNYYNLDPTWHKEVPGNRILLIEPDFFSKYPVSRRCIDFMLSLSKNIPGVQVYTGSFQSLVNEYKFESIFYKEHPLNTGYTGTEESRDWISHETTEYYSSFFGYWKKIEKQLFKAN